MHSRNRKWLHLTGFVRAFVLVTFVVAGPVVAQAASVDPSNVSGSPGDTVTLEISIDTAVTDMGAWGLDVYFDTDVLEYSGVDKTGTLSEPLTVDGSATSSGARVEASSAGDAATADAGILIKVLLTVKDTAYQNSAIQLDNFTDYLAGAETTDSVFTVLISIAVDSPGDPFLNDEGVHLVTSDATPSTATFSGTGAASGDYHWTLNSCGTIDSSTADTITYTAPAAIDDEICEDTLILTSASQPDALTDTIKISVYRPITITWPLSSAGMALNDETRTVTASGGTGAYTFQSSDEGVATVDDDGDISPVGVGTLTVKVRDQEFGALDTGNGFAAETAQIEVINPIVIANKPADGALLSEGVHQFTAEGGKVEGKVYWEASLGTIDADGNYTAPEVLNQSTGYYKTVKITAYDRTYNKNHPTPVKTTYTLTIYPTVVIATSGDFDAESPLAPGDELTLTGQGGNQECTWTVTGPAEVAGDDTSCTYTFAAPSEGDFAGVYEIAVSDGNGFTATFDVKVAMELVPEVLSFTETTTDGDPNPQPFEVSGTSGGEYTWEILKKPDDEDPAADPAAFGVWTQESPVSAEITNTFNPADVDKPMTFYVRVSVENDPDLSEENGLNRIVRGPYRIIPIRTFAGTVVDEGHVGIEGATVEVTAPAGWARTTQTDGSGFFGVNLADSGTRYLMRVSKAGYVSTDFSSDDLDDNEAKNNVIQLMTAAPDAYITGTVTVEGGQPTSMVHVQAYYDTEGASVLAGVTETTETFRFDFEADNSPYTLTASMPGYFAGTRVSGVLPVADVHLDLEPRTLDTCVDATAGGFTSFLEVPFGGIDTSDGADEVCFDLTVDETAWACGQGASNFFYDLTAVDQIQRAVTFTGDMTMTLSFDLSQVPPGAFETGEFAVYQADDLEDCTSVEVLDSDRIIATDYVGDGITGSVTFRASHLSDFGTGEAGPDQEGGLSGESDGRCFIATAAYGSPFDQHVKVLRQFRDVYLMSSKAGRIFVDTYYRVSPPAAEFIAHCDTLRALARCALWPFVVMSYVMLQIGLFGSVLAFAAVLLLCFGLWNIGRGRLRKGVLMGVPLVLACLIMVRSAQAEEKARYYGAVHGLYVVEDIGDSHAEEKFTIPEDVDFDDSWGFQARVGFIYNEYFSLEGMYEYIATFESKDEDLGVDLDVMNFMVNAKLTSPNYDLFVPYVIVGMGVMNAYEEIHFSGDSSDESDWGFGGRAGLGFDYYVKPDWTVSFEGAYVLGIGGVDHIRYLTLGLGVGYHW